MVQLYEDFSWLLPLYPFEAEREFKPHPEVWPGWLGMKFIDNNPLIPIAAVTVYIAFITIGPKLMIGRKPFQLRAPLILWNLVLSAFSAMGAIRTVPHLLNTIYQHGLYHSMCFDAEASYGHGPVGMWTLLFILSKFPELIDTVFIVARKRPLIFLHWYHHITVLLFCWHSYTTRSSAGLFFVAMNYTVHALMYFYYFLSACKIRVSWGMAVTIFQLSQMAVGVAACAGVGYYHSTGMECKQTRGNFMAGLGMYASYFGLFLVFFVRRFCSAKAAADDQPKLAKKGGKLRKVD